EFTASSGPAAPCRASGRPARTASAGPTGAAAATPAGSRRPWIAGLGAGRVLAVREHGLGRGTDVPEPALYRVALVDAAVEAPQIRKRRALLQTRTHGPESVRAHALHQAAIALAVGSADRQSSGVRATGPRRRAVLDGFS